MANWFERARFGMFVHWGHVSQRGWELSWPLVGGLPVFPACQDVPAATYHDTAATFCPRPHSAREWLTRARRAGMRYAVLTTKHHDGFALFPSRAGDFSIAATPYRGDLVREFVDACRAEGLGAGLYLSPWDRNHPAYGDSPRYNDVYADQLTELLTQYGRLNEVWFDGANGEGPNGKRQAYDWPRFFRLVRQLQPNAVMFSDAGPDVRWCGNEKGTAGDPNWSTMNPDAVPFPGADGPGIIDALQHGDRNGTVWRPAEVDVSIRPGWFYHPAEDDKVATSTIWRVSTSRPSVGTASCCSMFHRRAKVCFTQTMSHASSDVARNSIHCSSGTSPEMPVARSR